MLRVPVIAAFAVFVIHLIANPHYGFFRDELYFIICGRHPQWGYVDQPPLVPLFASATQHFGHSLLLLRAVPALFAAGGVAVTCALVTEFGGGAFAQILAALVFFFTPVLMSFGMKVSTDETGLFLWPLIALLVVRLVRGANSKTWLLIGLVTGLSFESKYSVVFLIVALLVGLLSTAERRILTNRWLFAGALVAGLIAFPNIVWQLHFGLPMLELLRNGQTGKNSVPSVPLYLLEEVIITNPLLALEWMVGLIWMLRAARWRFLSIAYLTLIGEMLALHGKHYYPANIYPILIAAGAVPIEKWTAGLGLRRRLVVAYVVIAGLVMLPDALPVLSERAFATYAAGRERLIHLSSKNVETEHGREDNVLPSDWADMHGWPELAAAARSAYNSLSPGERNDAVVFAGNYGEASAVAFFAPDVPVVSEHNQYWLWGPQGHSGKILIQINGSCFHSLGLYRSRTAVATLRNRYAIHDENTIPVWICRAPTASLSQIWPHIKDYE